MTKQRRRISNEELGFYEDNIARALGIIQTGKILKHWIDDEEGLEMLLSMVENAERIRAAHIERMNRRKGEAKEEPAAVDGGPK
jgi:hypothetical protein